MKQQALPKDPQTIASQIAVHGALQTRWMTVTPAMAERWLNQCAEWSAMHEAKHNRTLSNHTIGAYARDMAHGQWVTTHQGIAFDEDSLLIDGQHRLAAIVKAGLEQDMLVTKGLPREAKLAMDRGRLRTISDMLMVWGDEDATRNKVGLCSALARHQGWIRKDRLTVHEVQAIMDQYRAQILAVEAMTSKSKGIGHGAYRAALVGALFNSRGHDRYAEWVELFARIVKDGHYAQIDGAHPSLANTALTLRKIILGESGRAKVNNERQKSDLIFAATERAIKFFLDNTPRLKLHVPLPHQIVFDLPCPDFAAKQG